MSAAPIIRFLPYQRRWLEDGSRFKLGLFARQTGKTFTTSGEIVDDCVKFMIEQQRTRWVILSRGERQAKEAVDEAIKPMTHAFFHLYNAAASLMPEYQEDEFRVYGESGVDAVYKTQEVIFPHGGRITALPANPDTARGFSANLFLDEFAFHAHSKAIWAACFPIISKAGLRLRVTSTPNGKNNKFYELATTDDPVWSKHRVTIHEAVADGLDRDVDQLRRGLNDDDIWEAEYELKFKDDAGSVLTFELIAAAEDDGAGRPEGYTGGLCVIGNDIAVRRDLWVSWVMEIVGDVLVCRELVVRRGASFQEQDAIMDDLYSRYRVLRLAMDQTGLGEKPVADAKRRYGESRVSGVLFTGPAKLELANGLRDAFEKRRVRIPMGDVALRSDLHKVKKVQGATGLVRLVAESDAADHADRFWALALAIAAAGVQAEYGYTPAYGGAGGSRRGDERRLDDSPEGERLRFGRGAY